MATKKTAITPPAAPAKKAAAKKAPAKKVAAKKTTAAKPAAVAATPAAAAAPDREKVEQAAYLNYRIRKEKGLPGDPHTDWVEAERKLKTAD